MRSARAFAIFTSFLFTVSAWAGIPEFGGIRRDLPVPATQRAVAVGDFNGDGILDFAEAGQTLPNGVLLIALGSATGGYTYSEHSLSSSYPGGVAAVDVNGDGKLDLVAVGIDIQVFLGRGDGTFAPSITLSIGDSATSLAIADFNGDGKQDIALGISTGAKFFWGNGDGTFKAGTSLPGDQYPTVATTDFNRDTIPDLVVAGTNLSLYIGLGKGVFQKQTSAPPAGSVTEIALADFNGDRIPDLAVAFYSNSDQNTGVQVLLGAADGTFRSTTTMTGTGTAFTGVATGDFDGDGKPDLVALLWTGPAATSNELDAATVFSGNGDGTFGSGTSTPVGNRPEAAVAVDWNSDGKLDLIVSNFPDSSGSIYGVSVLQGLGNRSFRQASAVPTEPNAGTSAVARGDFNGDGLPDVITANANTSDVSVLLNQQNSALGAAIDSPAGLAAELLVVGDLNHDGKLDVVVAGRNSVNASVLLGKGDGTFLPPLTVPLGVVRHPGQIALSDFNGDGNLDLVAVGDGTDNVYVSFGLGSGGFAPPVMLTEKYSPEYVAVGDLNGDGYPDILTYQAGGFLFEFLSKGNGTFSAGIQLQGYDGLNNIALADVNGDGKLDVVFSSNPVTVSLGNGDGTFGPLIQSSNYSFSPGALTIADFNGDGKPDIAVACFSYNSVVILSGNGDGTFDDVGSYAARFYPTGIAAADLNGDGKLDIITSNSSGISFLRNVTQ